MTEGSDWEITEEDHERAEPGTQFIGECLECGHSVTSAEMKAAVKETLKTTKHCGTKRFRIYQTDPPELRDETN